MTTITYLTPVVSVIFIYWKLGNYIYEMRRRVTRVITIFCAKRQLKFVQRTMVLILISIGVCFPMVIFTLNVIF